MKKPVLSMIAAFLVASTVTAAPEKTKEAAEQKSQELKQKEESARKFPVRPKYPPLELKRGRGAAVKSDSNENGTAPSENSSLPAAK